jgi:hypothetical protein
MADLSAVYSVCARACMWYYMLSFIMVLRYFQILNKPLHQCFSPWDISPLRGPQQVSKGPQEKDGKLGGHSNITHNIADVKLN